MPIYVTKFGLEAHYTLLSRGTFQTFWQFRLLVHRYQVHGAIWILSQHLVILWGTADFK